jgi:hypothetical protein
MPIAVDRTLAAACEISALADACSTNTAVEPSAKPTSIATTLLGYVSRLPAMASTTAASARPRGPRTRAMRPESGVTTTATRNTA